MKSSTKDRIKLSVIAFFFLLVLLSIGYAIWGNPPVTGMYTGMVKIVNIDNAEDINRYEKYKTPYAYKLNENNKPLLKYITYDINKPINTTLTLTNEQYNELVEGEYYWFKIKLSKPNDMSNGIIKSIYTESPTQK